MNRAFLQTSKHGDILGILPILHHEWKTTGQKPFFVVSREFSQIVDRLDYIQPVIWEGGWDNLRGAIRFAKEQFNEVVVLSTFGSDFPIAETKSSFQLDQWARAGYLDKWDTLPLVLPRPKDAKAIVEKHLQGKPAILFGDHSQSSPFRFKDDLGKLLQDNFGKEYQILRLSELRLPHPLDLLALYDAAKLIVTIDTMHLHLCKASKTPAIALLSDVPSRWHGSAHSKHFRLCCVYADFPKRRDELIEAAKEALAGKPRKPEPLNQVSAVVPIYKPEAAILNRCLTSLIPQVGEIVVTRAADGVLPIGSLQNPKVRYVLSPESNIGFGRNCNFGARHTAGRFLIFVNDDVELSGDAVEKMVAEAKPDVGIVSPLLRFRDGTVQTAGCVRQPNARGWDNIDWRKKETTFKATTELEDVRGAVMLVRREAFYKAGQWDKDIFLYSEDDALCLAVRREGYRVIFTPHAHGFHDEGTSTRKLGKPLMDFVSQSRPIFERKWGAYLDHNATRLPLGNFDYLNGAPRYPAPSVAVVYVHVPGHDEATRQLVSSYLQHPSGFNHRVIVVCQGAATVEMKILLSKLNNSAFFQHDDTGWDIGAYIAVSKIISEDMMVCFGGNTYLKRSGWLKRMVEVWQKYGPGLYGSFASYEIRPHLNTTGFWCLPDMFRQYPHAVKTKADRYKFEHGENSFWKTVSEQAYPVKLVTWDGEYDWRDWRKPANIFRRGDQSNCLMGWRLTQEYDRAPEKEKRLLEKHSDTLTI